MGVSTKYQIFILSMILVFAIGVYVGREQPSFEAASGSDPAGHVSVKVWREGEIVYEYDTHNLITTIGSTQIRDFLGWTNHTNQPCSYLSLSNDATPLTSWTRLTNEIDVGVGLERASGTATVVNATAYQVTYTWTATGAQSVQCTGLHWDSTGMSFDNLLAAASISSVSLQNNDQLQVTWTVNIPDG
jgi:hypothetical protein